MLPGGDKKKDQENEPKKDEKKEIDQFPLNEVPIDLLVGVLGYLNIHDRKDVETVSKHFAESKKILNISFVSDLKDLLINTYNVPVENFPEIPENNDALARDIYRQLLTIHSRRLIETANIFIDSRQGTLSALEEAPININQQIIHLENAFRLVTQPDLHNAIGAFLDRFKRFQQTYKNNLNELLLKAIILGNQQAVSKLLTIGVDINAINKEGNSAIMLAIKHNHPAIIEILFNLREQLNLNIQNNDGDSALLLAIKQNQKNTIGNLLAIRADISAKNNLGETALMLAAQRGSPEILYLIAESKHIDIDAQRKTGETALIDAVRRDHFECANLLLKYRANPNITAANSCALGIAIHNGDHNMIKLLLECKANPEMTEQNVSILTFASQKGDFDTVSMLLKSAKFEAFDIFKAFLKAKNSDLAAFLYKQLPRDFDINSLAPDGKSFLMHALSNNNFDHLKFLIERKADINKISQDGFTPLRFVCDMHEDTKTKIPLIQFLLKQGADPNIPDGKGETTLNYLCKKLPIEEKIIRCLVENKSVIKTDINKQDSEGRTPLFNLLRLEAGNEKSLANVAQLLLEKKADISIESQTNRDALWYAVAGGHVTVAAILLKARADINADFKSHSSINLNPIRLAALNGDSEMFEMLCKKGANLNSMGADGLSLVFFAVSNANDTDRTRPFDPKTQLKTLNYILERAYTPKQLIDVVQEPSKLTPLMRAAQKGLWHHVQLLIRFKADYTLKSAEGLTALDYAKKELEELDKIPKDATFFPREKYDNLSKITSFLIETMSKDEQPGVRPISS